MILWLLILIIHSIQVKCPTDSRVVCYNRVYFLCGFRCFSIDLYDEMTTKAAYCSSPVITHPSIHSNSFFTNAAAVTGSNNVLLSTQYGISPSLYHRQESGN
jgi:hypothetical protein